MLAASRATKVSISQVQQGQGQGSWSHLATPAPESQTMRMAEVTLSSAEGGRRRPRWCCVHGFRT